MLLYYKNSTLSGVCDNFKEQINEWCLKHAGFMYGLNYQKYNLYQRNIWKKF